MFKKGRRVPRKVGVDEDEELDISTTVVQRPSAKPKPSSALRSSFAPNNAHEEANAAGDIALSIPNRKATLSRLAVERQAELRERLPFRAGEPQDRPSYSADYLAELKSSTPTKARVVTQEAVSESNSSHDLDISSKFGPNALTIAPSESSLIPTDAEIREKKERRRRLAKEQEYISLDADKDGPASDSEDDDPRNRSLILPAEELKPKERYAETRLIHEDEDMAEGFDEFTEDAGQVTLGKKAAREQEQRRRKELQEIIQSAQHGSSDSESADSEEEARKKAYEAAQTRAGTYGSSIQPSKTKSGGLQERLKMTPKITPLPELGQAACQIKEYMRSLMEAQEGRRRKLEEIRAQREDLVKEQERLPILMKESAERYEKWRTEIGLDDAGPKEVSNGTEAERGLENFGATAVLPDA